MKKNIFNNENMVKQKPEILIYLLEDQLEGDPTFTSKSMFGGYGIYRYGQIFAICDGSSIYFKVDERNKQDFLDHGSEPFRYKKKNGVIGVMSYFELPEEILENREELLTWIDKSLSIKSIAKKKAKKTSKLDQKILNYLLEIPKGKVSTYKRVADKFGVHPRKIASVMKYNKFPGKFPCYKIISESGKLSGYNAKNGVCSKIELLKEDGVKIENGKISSEYIV